MSKEEVFISAPLYKASPFNSAHTVGLELESGTVQERYIVLTVQQR